MKQVNLNNALEVIGSGAFVNCEGLTGEFLIPASVTKIKSAAFSDTNIDAFVFKKSKYGLN